jgi:hypothetical protein
MVDNNNRLVISIVSPETTGAERKIKLNFELSCLFVRAYIMFHRTRHNDREHLQLVFIIYFVGCE